MPAKSFAETSQWDLSTEAVDKTVEILMRAGFTKELALETLCYQLHANLVEIKKFYATREVKS